ncbi:tryptophan synthase subunit alpha [Albibacterium indicum]|uniref:tryptophan synthase subunit alpha n=1 Tax=Albibacterium indicum TaxID=2292082 RepID=UPI000E5542C9|nr:tryptophan synthase subunit alpha [Pedobacter indicus]
MNRIKELFNTEDKNRLSIYYTAGYPKLDSTLEIAERLENSGVDFLEIGFPYSDPLADGPVIQHASQVALRNGMTLDVLFEQLADLRKRVTIPVFLMGYVNPVIQYGVERFCESCARVGVDGVIIPDLPMYEYEELYQDVFAQNGLSNIFLVTPQTSDERIRKIDELSTGFIYLLSSSSTTGKNLDISEDRLAYFNRIKQLNLKNPFVIGFGISNSESFRQAAEVADGAIVGTAFVKQLETDDYLDKISPFIEKLKA